MIGQYVKFGLRTLKKDKKSTLLLISGMTISLVAVILIGFWATDELTFNNKFSKSNRIYQLAATFDNQSDQFTYSSPAPIATFAKDEIPAVEEVSRILKYNMTFFNKSAHSENEEGIFADASFFKIFDLSAEFLDKNEPFPSDHSIVITQKFADKFFPNETAIGKTIELELDLISNVGKEPFVVSAVVEDFPENSSLKGSFILPYGLLKRIKGENYDTEWGNFQNSIYFLLSNTTNTNQVADQLTKIQKQKFGTEDGSSSAGLYNKFEYYLQNIQQLNLYNPKGKAQGVELVYSILALGIIILAISSANYINLVTAKATKRGKEISLRKIIGASKRHLFLQYLTESCIIFAVSLVLAFILSYIMIPYFNELTGKNIQFNFFSYEVYGIVGITFISTLLLAGIYPAVLFSSNKLIQLIKSGSNTFGTQQQVRKGLVILQFTFTLILITGSIVFQKQIQYMRNKDLGYNKENVFLFEQKNFMSHYDVIRDELEKQPGIAGVTAASSNLSNFGSETADISWEGKTLEQTNFFITQVAVDRNFNKVLGIPLSIGDGFSGTAADSNRILLNEKAVQEMGIKDPIGKTIEFQGKTMSIAAVMKNFNFNDLKTEIKPCAFFLGNNKSLGGMYIKAAPNKVNEAITSVQKYWSQYNPGHAFNYSFLDESFDKLYKKDLLSTKLVFIFSALAIILSCMGLVSLIIFTTELKIKEIGIRKTLGASVNSIIVLISKEYLKIILLSVIIASPISWLITSNWLDNYVYRTTLDWWIFLFAVFLILGLALLSTIKISINAAKANPVDALRDYN